MSVILIAILLSAALFAGIAAADEELLVNETQFIPPAEGGQGMLPPPMPFDNGTMPVDPAAIETAEIPVPVLGIVAGLGAAVFFLTRRT